MKISSLKNYLDVDIYGDTDYEVFSLSSIDNPEKQTIIYVSDIRLINKENIEKYGAVLIKNKYKDSLINGMNFLLVDDIASSLSIISKLLHNESTIPICNNKKKFEGVIFSEDVKIGINVKIGKGCRIGSNVVIEDNVTIGENTYLEHNVVIKHNSLIGDNCGVGPGTIIGSEGFGNLKDKSNIWHHIKHSGNVILKDNITIGANCTIDRATFDSTIIDHGVIIDNQVHIAHNVFIGENTAIAAKVGIAGSCVIGKRNMLGGMVGIIDHVNTVDDVIVSATSTVYKDIKEPGLYTGILPISKHVVCKRIALWITKLDKIAKLLDIKNK